LILRIYRTLGPVNYFPILSRLLKSERYTAKMTAQLVLQFTTGEGLDSFDRLIRFEKELISIVGKTAKVDGHFGSGDIFILTEDPAATFTLVQQANESIRPTEAMRAAYRLIGREDYVCLWPPELSHFDIA
jgi:hypothetical protein